VIIYIGDEDNRELCLEEMRQRAEQKRRDRISRKQLEEKAAMSRLLHKEITSSTTAEIFQQHSHGQSIMSVRMTLDDDMYPPPHGSQYSSSTRGIKRTQSVSNPHVSNPDGNHILKRRNIAEPTKGGFIAAKQRDRLQKAYSAIHQTEVSPQ
jgi:hypothetical protein